MSSPSVRSCPNDGKCDAAGRLWVGSKVLKQQEPPAGRLFVVERSPKAGIVGMPSAARVVDEVGAVSVSNGIGFSPANDTMYYVDSPTRCIFAFAFDNSAGAISNKRVLADVRAFAPPGAVPDGLAVDAMGAIWVALWDGGAIVQLSERGDLLRRVELPVSRPTCVAFGDNGTLYCTTCSYDVGDAAPLSEPLAGAVFALEVGVSGVGVCACRL